MFVVIHASHVTICLRGVCMSGWFMLNFFALLNSCVCYVVSSCCSLFVMWSLQCGLFMLFFVCNM